MPLRVVRRPGREGLYLRGTVRGQRVFESAGTADHALAEEVRAKRERELFEAAIYGTRAVVSFARAVNSYLDAAPRSPATCRYVSRLLSHLGQTKLHEITQVALDRAYRALVSADASQETRRRAVFTPLCAVLEHAARRGWCDPPRFEAPRGRAAPRTTFLTPAQASALVQGATALEHRVLFTFLIACGTRASEAFDLPWADVDLRGARARVRQKQGTWREVNLPPVALAALASLPHRDGFVFRPPERLYAGRVAQAARYADTGRDGGGQVATAFGTACRRAGLPGRWVETARRADRYWQPAVRLHDLRHTWASAHYAMHKDILRLMVDGGWSNPKMVQRYAHLMPEVYAEEWREWLAGGIAAVEQRTA